MMFPEQFVTVPLVLISFLSFIDGQYRTPNYGQISDSRYTSQGYDVSKPMTQYGYVQPVKSDGQIPQQNRYRTGSKYGVKSYSPLRYDEATNSRSNRNIYETYDPKSSSRRYSHPHQSVNRSGYKPQTTPYRSTIYGTSDYQPKTTYQPTYRSAYKPSHRSSYKPKYESAHKPIHSHRSAYQSSSYTSPSYRTGSSSSRPYKAPASKIHFGSRHSSPEATYTSAVYDDEYVQSSYEGKLLYFFLKEDFY